jgi:large subunit ribosomal protein L21
MLAEADGKVSVGSSIKTKVKAEIVDQLKGDTVIAYKQKRRKGFHKKKGHRTAYTKIKVTDIK